MRNDEASVRARWAARLGTAPATDVGVGLAGANLAGEVETCVGAADVNVPTHREAEGSGPAPTFTCDQPGCKKTSTTLAGIRKHMSDTHGISGTSRSARARVRRDLPSWPGRTPAEREDVQDLAALILGRFAGKPILVGRVRVWMEPEADGVLAVMAALIDDHPTGGDAA